MFSIIICVFQVQDLAVASPATVSRCGMVYIDPDELKWMPYVQTWISGLGAKVVYTVSLSYPDHLEHGVIWYLVPQVSVSTRSIPVL